MKKIFIALIVLATFLACKSNIKTTSTDLTSSSEIITKFGNTINTADVKEHIYVLASDAFEGRQTGERGQKMAAEYLADQYKKFGILGINGADDYYQYIPVEDLNNKSENSSENVIAFIEGSEKPNEILVISSHYDHLGIHDNETFFGADDNASGTTAVLEIAQAFANAKKEGYGPKRSILFVNFTGEEKGLLGSKYFSNNPVYPLKNMIAGLNIDMIGRIGKEREPNDDNYVYVIGANRLSSELHNINEKANTTYTHLELDYTYNELDDPNKFYNRSDHYNLAKHNIPIIFYFNGVHADYHKATDTKEKINLELLKKRAQLVFYTAWEIVNREDRLVVDKASVLVKS